MPPKPRTVRRAIVLRKERLSEALIRVVFTGEELKALPELPFTDHYIKLVFPPAGADYSVPLSADQIAEVRENRPREEWPVTRTYTIRSYDAETNEMVVDFVVHGDEGLAGPWSAKARVGDEITFFGPGGAWAPDLTADYHAFVGDEAAIPAIAAALDSLPSDAVGSAWLEVATADARIPVPSRPGVEVHWIARDRAAYGTAVASAFRSAEAPRGKLSVFIHGEALMIKDLRRYLFIENAVPRDQVSISGYWRAGNTEDGWQTEKHEFMAQVEAEEAAAAGVRS